MNNFNRDQEEITNKLEKFKQKYLPNYKISPEKQRKLNTLSGSNRQLNNISEQKVRTPAAKALKNATKIDQPKGYHNQIKHQ